MLSITTKEDQVIIKCDDAFDAKVIATRCQSIRDGSLVPWSDEREVRDYGGIEHLLRDLQEMLQTY